MKSRNRRTDQPEGGPGKGRVRPPESARAAKEKTAEFESAARRADGGKYVLRLYVAGSTPRSMRAIENIRRICEEHLRGRYELEVVDVYQDPGAARSEQLLALPTLVKKLPSPLKKFIGDLSDIERILVGLDIVPVGSDRKTGPSEGGGRTDGGER